MMYKSFLLCALIFAGLFFSIPFVSAQTSSSADLQALVKQLQEQIKTLQSQVQELTAQLSVTQKEAAATKQEVAATKQEVAEVKQELRLTKSLKRGERGDEVKKLQEFLTEQFPDLYPEGLITGFFGPATEAAVRKLQAKHGIEQLGIIGPRTIAKINELITEGAGRSGVIPPGLLRAPGIQKKLDDALIHPAATATPVTSATTTPAIPVQLIDQTGTTTVSAISAFQATSTVATSTAPAPPPPPPSLTPPSSPTPPPSSTPTPPPSSTATTTTDTTSPTVPTNFSLSDVTYDTIKINWSASTDNVGVVGYKVYRENTEPYSNTIRFLGTYSLIATVTAIFYTDTGLLADTPYDYKIIAYDAAGNVSSQVIGLHDTGGRTLPGPSSAVVISNVRATNITSSGAVITWTTDKVAYPNVEWGSAASFSVCPCSNGSGNLYAGTQHSVTLGGLSPNTTYIYRVLAQTTTGSLATVGQSSHYTFTTAATAPTTSNVDIDTALRLARIQESLNRIRALLEKLRGQ